MTALVVDSSSGAGTVFGALATGGLWGRRNLTAAAALILSTRVRDRSPTLYEPPGLHNTSTAPSSSARSAFSLPWGVSELITITGRGMYFINFPRNVRPSILGISRSRVMTSGRSCTILSRATYGSQAVATTSMSYIFDSSFERICRTTAESSTIRTLITGFSWRGWSSHQFKGNLGLPCFKIQHHGIDHVQVRGIHNIRCPDIKHFIATCKKRKHVAAYHVQKLAQRIELLFARRCLIIR